jgi:septal ring factor EnvC (AmiA/AmiB activator)
MNELDPYLQLLMQATPVIVALVGAYIAMRRFGTDRKKSLAETVTLLSDQVYKAETKIEALRASIDEQNLKIDALENDNKRLLSKVQELEEKNDAQRIKIDALGRENKRLLTRVKELENENARLREARNLKK